MGEFQQTGDFQLRLGDFWSVCERYGAFGGGGGVGAFERILCAVGSFGGFEKVSERLRHFWSTTERFGGFRRIMQRLGEFGGIGESIGVFQRILQHLGEFCSIWESFGALH